MTELFSADFFDRAEAAAGRITDHSNSNFGEVQAALSQRADQIRQSRNGKQNRKTETKKKLSREQFANKVELKHEESRNAQQQPSADLRFFND